MFAMTSVWETAAPRCRMDGRWGVTSVPFKPFRTAIAHESRAVTSVFEKWGFVSEMRFVCYLFFFLNGFILYGARTRRICMCFFLLLLSCLPPVTEQCSVSAREGVSYLFGR